MSLHLSLGVQLFRFLSPHTLTSVHKLENQDHRRDENSPEMGHFIH